MIREPRSFSLTEAGFRALNSCEKCYPHLKRGQLVSIALENMARQIEASRRAQFRLPDLNEWKQIYKTLSEIEAFHHETMADFNCSPLSIDPNGEEKVKEKILFEVEELSRLRARVSKLAPLSAELSSKEHESLRVFMEIAQENQSDQIRAAAFGIAIKLLGGLL